jgi:hypothetical protein
MNAQAEELIKNNKNANMDFRFNNFLSPTVKK